MIVTRQKSFEDILSSIGGSSVFIIGCGACATLCKTGGKEEVIEMKRRLEESGVEVSGHLVVDEVCHRHLMMRDLRPHLKHLSQDGVSVLILACGDGVQTAARVIPEGHMVAGLDSLFVGETCGRGRFEKRCELCGDCMVDDFEGMCPISRCPKHLLDGPCGGMSDDGLCELGDGMKCVWYDIMKRRDGHVSEVRPLKDWSRSLESVVEVL